MYLTEIDGYNRITNRESRITYGESTITNVENRIIYG